MKSLVIDFDKVARKTIAKISGTILTRVKSKPAMLEKSVSFFAAVKLILIIIN
jgi:hypothetical protein